jgi:hypothetical protein
MPITYSALAQEAGIDWRTIKRWAEKEITRAQAVQARQGKSARRQEEEIYAERLDEKDQEVQEWRQKYNKLLAQVMLMEGNARRVGLDPDELYKPLVPPDRSVSRAGRKRKRARR